MEPDLGTVARHDWLVAPGFERVADRFAEIAAEPDELGAAFAAVVAGAPVLDLWAGHVDRERRTPWRRHTIAPMFSGTKGVVAVALLMLVDQGRLDLDAPVGRYWPEYAVAGKETTLVRHAVSHLAGVPGLRAPVTPRDLLDHRAMTALLAAQAPLLPPGRQVAYHVFTFGWLAAELVRRIDGRGIGRFVAEEISAPLGLDAWIGLPRSLEERVARLEFDPPAPMPHPIDEIERDPLLRSVLLNPPVIPRGWWETRAFRAAQVAAGNGIGSARSMARLYGCLAAGGAVDGVRLLGEDAVRIGRTPLARGLDAVSGGPTAFGVGFQVPAGTNDFGGMAGAFGHGGVGGGLHGAWPGAATGFSFLPTRIRDTGSDTRARRLLAELALAVGASPPTATRS